MEDMNSQAQANAAEQYKASQSMDMSSIQNVLNGNGQETDSSKVNGDEEDSEDGSDETGLEAKDILLIMEQAQVSRPQAVKALKANDNDIVNAIMELSGM